jgi:hypothetical protein
MEQIDRYGKIGKNDDISINILYIFFTVLPKSNSKYLKFVEIRSLVKTIKFYRTLYKILIPFFISLILIVLYLDKNKLIS